jgi:hypothetical protein
MQSIEIIKNKLAKLQDEYQHYTMVDFDSCKAAYIKYEIDELKVVLKDLFDYQDLVKNINQEINVLQNKIRGHYLNGNDGAAFALEQKIDTFKSLFKAE